MSERKGWRNDGYAKVTGRSRYADDMKFHNMLHAVPVYSDHVHAYIIKIDVSKAEQSEGVIRVITYKDVPGENRFGQIHKDYYMFAEDRIRGNGDVVALIVAKTREEAIEAIGKVTVEVEQLPLLLDPEEALKSDSILIHEEKKTNIVTHHKVRRGSVEEGFKNSDIILEREYKTQLIEHSYMEPESSVCIPRHDGVMEVFGSMQHPFSTRRFVATLLGKELSEVEVKGTPTGGGFGGKDDTAAIVCARTALAAMLTKHPVKMTYKREWSIKESYKRHPYKLNYKMGLDKSGKIKAVECRFLADAGNYTSVTPWVLWRSTVQCCGPYKVDNVKCDALGVHTNNIFTGAMRGFGSPQVNFAIESLIEEAAEMVGLSPMEIRKRNMVMQGDETITGQILENHTVNLSNVFEKVQTEIGFEEKLKKCSHGKSDTDELYGIGIAISYRGMSLGAEGKDYCSAIINAQPDGSVLLEAGVHENGQGLESAMLLILAEQLGIKKERIRYQCSSTSTIPDGGTTVASRGTIMGGGAITKAADNFKKLIAETLFETLDCTKEDFVFENDGVSISATGTFYTFEEIIQMMFSNKTYPYAFGLFQGPEVSWDEEVGKGNAYFTWVYGCQAVELTVDKVKGKVKLLNAVAAHDVGKAINEEMLLGQFYGGMVMGMGYALREEVKTKDGKVRSTNFHKYHLTRAKDVPDMKAIIVESVDPLSPSGAKGVGEPTNEIMAPAIANAIYNATGKRYYKLPIKIEL
ncbi:MAG: xanthine dehydrogenase family protein molybdopterin-binding subunit [Bacteroidetes bacterium]|nr:xanthine dehydrogenase family protein molybdopterin-binding subunit [Bacteroidota bacterium]